MKNKTNNIQFWKNLEALVKTSKVVIERPKGTSHPRYPELIYPLDYGYLSNTTSNDGDAIDVWVGSCKSQKVTGIMCIIDTKKRDSEIKVLYECSDSELDIINSFHNQNNMNGILIKKT